MEIKNKTHQDPATELPVVEAYMTWALKATDEVVGRQGLAIILRENGLERFIDHCPPPNLVLNRDICFADYANLCTAVMKFYGQAGKSVVIRIGRIKSRLATEKQGTVFSVARIIDCQVSRPTVQAKAQGRDLVQQEVVLNFGPPPVATAVLFPSFSLPSCRYPQGATRTPAVSQSLFYQGNFMNIQVFSR